MFNQRVVDFREGLVAERLRQIDAGYLRPDIGAERRDPDGFIGHGSSNLRLCRCADSRDDVADAVFLSQRDELAPGRILDLDPLDQALLHALMLDFARIEDLVEALRRL